MPLAWHFVTACLAAFLGIAAHLISAWDNRRFQPRFDDDFTRFLGKVVRYSQPSAFFYFCGFAFVIGLLPRSPQAFTGLLMVSPFVFAFCIDVFRGTGSHNLAPFELLNYFAMMILGTAFAMLGMLSRAGLHRFLPARPV